MTFDAFRQTVAMNPLITNKQLRRKMKELRERVDPKRLAELERHEESLWKANGKMWRILQDFDRLRDCMCYMIEHGLCGADDTLRKMLPIEFSGEAEYLDSDFKVWNPWWRKIKYAPEYPSSPRRPKVEVNRDCRSGKVVYETMDEATKMAIQYRQRPYHCEWCKKYHLTSRVKVGATI